MSELRTRLDEFTLSLTESEYHNYKTVLALASGGLIRADRGSSQAALSVATNVLAASRNRPKSARFGIAWQGRPEFLTVGKLENLIQESRQSQSRATRVEDHKVVPGGEVAKEFAQCEAFLQLVTRYAGSAVSTDRSTYLYYDEIGMGIDPHIDNPEFAVNAILMLEHKHKELPSALTFYEGADSRSVHLQSGELIIFFADSVVHARERMKEGEFLAVVAFGFQPT